MKAVWGGRIVNGLGELYPLELKCALPLYRCLPPGAFESDDQTDAQHRRVHRRQPGQQHFLIPRNEVESEADRQTYDGIDGGGHRRPGQPKPQ